MEDASIAMFKTTHKIHGWLELQKCFVGTYAKRNDVDGNGKAKIKPFIPSSLRVKQPIDHSKKVRNESRCVNAYAKMTTITKEARAVHKVYKQNMAAFLKQMEKMEIHARKELLEHQYCSVIVEIMEGLAIVGESTTKALKPSTSNVDLTHIIIMDTFKNRLGSYH